MSRLPSTNIMSGGMFDAPEPIPQPTAPSMPAGLRGFGDATATRAAIYDEVFKAASTLPPVSNQRHTLRLTGVQWADPDKFTKAQHKQAILSGGTLGRRLRGTWELVDNANNEVVDRRDATIARVPHLTDGGTFVHRGTDYALKHQSRLRPGVYVHRKENNEVSTHVNVLSGGPTHHYDLDQAKGTFSLRVGQANIPLMPLARALGASDKDLREAWGDDLFAANYSASDGTALRKLIAKFKIKLKEGEIPEQTIKAAFEKMTLDPEVTSRTLKSPYTNVGKDSLLAATKKLLAVSRGEEEGDDRNHLAYQTFVGPEDLFAERLTKDRAGLRRQLLYKASNRGDLRSLPPRALQDYFDAALMESGLGEPLAEVSPLEVLDKNTIVTRMGEGAIGCHSADTEVLTRSGWKAWPDVSTDDELATQTKDGRLCFAHPSKIHVGDFDGYLHVVETREMNYAVTPDHRMWVSTPTSTPDNRMVWRDYRFVTAADLHGIRCRHKMALGTYTGGKPAPAVFVVPSALRGQENCGSARDQDLRIPFDAWIDFLGYYLADGSFSFTPRRREYRVSLAKRQSVNPCEYELMRSALERAGIHGRYEQDCRFTITSKHLAGYVKQFGKAKDKFVPDYVLEGDEATRRRFFTAITSMDGRWICKTCFVYESMSETLAAQVGWLAITLGYNVHYLPSRASGCARLSIKSDPVCGVTPQRQRGEYKKMHYRGRVYCATVPGDMLLTRRHGCLLWSGNSTDAIPDDSRSVQPSYLGYIDPVRTPESDRAGIDAYVTNNVRKGPKGTLYARFRDVSTGQEVWKTPQEASDMAVAFPGSLREPGKRVKAMKGGKITYVPRGEVALEPIAFEHTFNALSNLVPLKSMSKGQRAAMAGRMITQALPLVNPQAPLVQSGVPGRGGMHSYEDEYGNYAGAIRADKGGQVTGVSPAGVQVRYDDGSADTVELHQMLPFNRKTYMNQTPVVRPGQRFNPGDLLARSNFTDDTGAVAVGQNLRVAAMPWGGKNFEDAISISESTAKRLSSVHAYQHPLEVTEKTRRGKGTYIGLFPSRYNRQQLDRLDDNGVAKIGTPVNFGDPLVLAAEERASGHNKIHRRNESAFNDSTVTWDHHDPGVVTDVFEGKSGPLVVVQSTHAMQVGDKLSNRFGGKGVIGDIIPDSKMPHDKQGRPFEVLINPMGLVSRVNPSQWAEAALGKLAEKLGHPIKVEDFDDVPDRTEWVLQQLQAHGIPDTEDVTDPEHGNKIPGVMTGNMFFMKLEHMAASKGQGRGGGGYTAMGEPAKGGPQGSKRVSVMDANSLLSAGAIETLRDAGAVRGQRNEDYWLQFMQGHSPSPPKVPMVYEKFVNSLKAAGVNVVRSGPRTQIMAMTDKDVDALAGDREIQNGDTVRFDQELKPIKDGLFDQSLTGGHHGNQWSSVKLHEPMLSPVFEEPARRLLGLTKQKLEDTIAGKNTLGDHGTGPGAVASALGAIDLDREITRARGAIAGNRKGARDEAIRRLGYLKSAQKLGIHPKDWVLRRVPVLPPQFRPVSMMGAKNIPLVDDSNMLYRDLIEANDNLKHMSEEAGEESAGEERLAVYKAFKAVTGLGDPVSTKNQERGAKGLLKTIFGSSPKQSWVQRKLISRTVDNVGRAVIAPDPDLDMDSVGLPEDRAFDVYGRFIARRLKRSNMPLAEALKHVRDRTPLARKVLLEEMQERPVMISRAPVLHRFGIMAFKPQLSSGSALKMPTLVYKGYGADNDGDSCIGSTVCYLCFLPEVSKLAGMPTTSTTEAAGAIDAGSSFSCAIADFPRREETARVDTRGVTHYEVPPGLCAMSYDAVSGRTGFFPVTEFTIHPDLTGYTVRTTGRHEVGVSDDHSLYVYDVKAAGMVRCRPADAVGKAVPVVKRSPPVGTLLQVVLPQDVMSPPMRRTKEYTYQPADAVSADFDFGWWLGAAASDAWTDMPIRGSIHYAKACPELVAAFRDGCGRLCEGLVGRKTLVTRHVDVAMGLDADSHRTSFDSTPLARLVKAWFTVDGNRAINKQLPPFLALLPEACLWGVLSGLLDGDSCVRINRHPARRTAQLQCFFTTVSPHLRDNVRLLCRLLGLRGHVSTNQRPGKDPVYVTMFSTVDLYRHRDRIVLRDPDKRRAWDEMPEVTKDDYDKVPVPYEVGGLIMAIIKAAKVGGYTDASTARNGRLVTRPIARRWLAMLRDAGHADARPITDWAVIVENEDVMWERVESLEPIERQTMYDITVPGTNVFAVNDGLIIYDTMSYHVPVGEEARQEALDRLLPSKQLLSPADFKTPVHAPAQEYTAGNFVLTSPEFHSKRPPQVFRSRKDVVRAWMSHKLSPGDPVSVLED